MIFKRLHACAAILSLTCCDCRADLISQKNEIGQLYSRVRHDLIKRGYAPVSQGNLQYNCDMVDNVCSFYPEEMDCGINVVNQPAICSFQWKSKTGQRYTITTAGEDPHKLHVKGVSPMPQSLFDKGLTR